MNKSARYGRIHDQIQALMPKSQNRLARMASVCAILHHKMPQFFWTGFYLLTDDKLVVSVYQGPVACMELTGPLGVCWTGVLTGRTVIVPDVHQFEGHVACDSRSKSEIVVPFFDSKNKLIGVLDIDSEHLNTFDQIDAQWLEKIISLITKDI